MSKYKHTDSLYNSGLVCGRLLDINRALLQQVEVTISVVWDQNQIPIPTSGNIYRYRYIYIPVHLPLLASSILSNVTKYWRERNPLKVAPIVQFVHSNV